MPIENERKFVLNEDSHLEPRLAQVPGVTRSRLSQAYLDSAGVRIRSIETAGKLRHVFSFKPPDVPTRLASHLLGLAPLGDPRFTSKRLADQAHAEKLLAEIIEKGSVS